MVSVRRVQDEVKRDKKTEPILYAKDIRQHTGQSWVVKSV